MSEPARPDAEELLRQADCIRRLAGSLTQDPASADDASQDMLVTARSR
jgi:DNA-directed RNA polymerase specialized sigma24 family protein